MKAPALTRLVTFKTLTKDGTEEEQNQFYPQPLLLIFFFPIAPNKHNVESRNLTVLKRMEINGSSAVLERKEVLVEELWKGR